MNENGVGMVMKMKHSFIPIGKVGI
jgi:hypothetical protein